MFTGQYSSENGMWRGNKGIKRDENALRIFFRSRLRHGLLRKMAYGIKPGGLPNDRGFDEFRGFLSGTHGYWVTKQRNRILHNGEPDDSEGHTTELFTQWSANFIRKSVAQKTVFLLPCLQCGTWPDSHRRIKTCLRTQRVGRQGSCSRRQFPA